MTMGDFQEGTKLIQGTRCRFKWAKRFETFYEKFVVDFLVKVSAFSAMFFTLCSLIKRRKDMTSLHVLFLTERHVPAVLFQVENNCAMRQTEHQV
jgi:hypothetical protein